MFNNTVTQTYNLQDATLEILIMLVGAFLLGCVVTWFLLKLFAKEKKNRKYCDWIVANNVSNSEIGFNSEYNAVSIIYNDKVEKIEKNLKSYIANKIARKIINNFIQ